MSFSRQPVDSRFARVRTSVAVADRKDECLFFERMVIKILRRFTSPVSRFGFTIILKRVYPWR